MERLTMLIDSHLLDNGKLDKEYSLNNKMEFNDFSCMDIPNAVYNKLGELEDVLEKYGIESAEDLDNIINSIRTNTFIDIENKEILELENANLKSELAELKQKAIVPKFSIGQEVWAISVYRKDCVDNFIIQEICFCSPYGLYYKTNMGINLYEYYFDIFATKEEAEQKLAEI